MGEAGDALLHAKHFKEVLNVGLGLKVLLLPNIYFQLILMIGNYMNGTGIKGGAFGFRVSSINKVDASLLSSQLCLISLQLVDTKSVNNTTLLHFLERTIHKHFLSMEEFLDELAKPAEAYRGSLLFYNKPRLTDITHFSEYSGYPKRSRRTSRWSETYSPGIE